MSKHKKFIDEKIKEIAKEKAVLDVGGGKRFSKWLAEHKDLFANCDYKTLDYDKNTGADIVGDIHNMPIEDESIGAIICSSALEHVKSPAEAVKEMRRVLKKHWKIFVYVPSIYPYHGKQGSYPDYWRFFDDTIKILAETNASCILLETIWGQQHLDEIRELKKRIHLVAHPRLFVAKLLKCR